MKDKPFIFFMNKGWRNNMDRGGTMYGVEAYLQEFSSKDNVLLIIKVNPAYGIPNIPEMINQLKPKDKTDLPLIQIMTNEITVKELVQLYQDCNVFVSPTRAEAFNLPCIEALACGKPVITTNFGGQSEYINEKNGFLIGGELKEVEHDIIYEGIRWLTPDIKELKESLRFAYNNPQILKNMSSECLKTAQMYTWEATAKKIVELLR